MKIIRQLAKEFWFPFLVAGLWTWSLRPTSTRDGITAFSSAFFLMSWATGQVFRVYKQVKVEQGISGIENTLNQVRTEAKQNLVVARLALRMDQTTEGMKTFIVALLNHGKPVPLYAEHIRWHGQLRGSRVLKGSSPGVELFAQLQREGLCTSYHAGGEPHDVFGLWLSERGIECAEYLKDHEGTLGMITEIENGDLLAGFNKFGFPPCRPKDAAKSV